MEQSNKVSLGCGTLILIAIIVLIFSSHGNDLGPDIQQLKTSIEQQRGRINELEMKIDRQTQTLDTLLKEGREHRSSDK
jgi:cell division protein FtsL